MQIFRKAVMLVLLTSGSFKTEGSRGLCGMPFVFRIHKMSRSLHLHKNEPLFASSHTRRCQWFRQKASNCRLRYGEGKGVPAHDMKTYAAVEAQLHSFIARHEMEVSGRLHTADASPRARTSNNHKKVARWAPEQVWILGEDILPTAGI